jgi:hypothetical protein
MAAGNVPRALAERLGDDGTEGLLTLLASAKADWADAVVTSAVERFERRLTTEIVSLRVDFTREMMLLRQDMTTDMSALRQDMTTDMSALRQDMTTDISALRQDMTAGMSALRQDFTKDLSGVRVELLKWSFLFWVGQVAAVAGLLAFMLRA